MVFENLVILQEKDGVAMTRWCIDDSSLLSWSQTPETEASVLQGLVLLVVGLIFTAFLLILALKFLGELVT
ncbi:hypothetical protein Pcinc_027216 [Petrolisthes cinctipes]|uniref:Uncharacterized protein n=1 Tax=Petrolisthes cinctipes TaxID=88211 RepID=A0AAE1K956_PETCI|nr:hypothetical protein Pcinc_027216 [Petrolisthes cinctipes]